ncbi:hypothetical protein NOJ28_03895 [Neorhizobium galegae]|uniref:hypothetical protein n=1 Tax=Neorhizobium galegae TaxID=399 RepID=UPI0006224EE4|nr:hypothetical protein [Neorhizobium galegae]MCQ1764665.1 hypothetical protein [Neorhizobium galegae]MCQ1847779.1 hypothetical protein [Neorhizobium galegae]CDZ37550.1 Hypothetical protein NGAL_HAMBI1146_24320 [Neorhizobium galegae bv. officinalis]
MIESVSGATEATPPSVPSAVPHAAVPSIASSAASISATLAAGQVATYAGSWEAATRHAAETSAISGRSGNMHARSLEAVDDVVVRNLLDSLSPSSRVAGSFFLADGEEPAPRSLIATYYEDV